MISRMREQGTGILLACHDIDQMFRLADRIVVLRHGRVAAEVMPAEVHPDDVVALLSGPGAGLLGPPPAHPAARAGRPAGVGRPVVQPVADPVRAGRGAGQRAAVHPPARRATSWSASAALGLPPELLAAWSRLPAGPAGGPVGVAAQAQAPIIDDNARAGLSWAPFGDLARAAKVAASWSVPVFGPGGLLGVITVLRSIAGRPKRDDLDLVTLYAGLRGGGDRAGPAAGRGHHPQPGAGDHPGDAGDAGRAAAGGRRPDDGPPVAAPRPAGGRGGAGDQGAGGGGAALPGGGHGGQRAARGRASPGLLDAAAGVLGVARRDDVARAPRRRGRPPAPGGDVRRAGLRGRAGGQLAGRRAARGRQGAARGRRALAAAGAGARGGLGGPPGGADPAPLPGAAARASCPG